MWCDDVIKGGIKQVNNVYVFLKIIKNLNFLNPAQNIYLGKLLYLEYFFS